uniref:Uncharacterized protein n=1 Tax=Anguilla anguilla TaxID=7936 RepID=A0A0E9Q5S6_ANGAN
MLNGYFHWRVNK